MKKLFRKFNIFKRQPQYGSFCKIKKDSKWLILSTKFIFILIVILGISFVASINDLAIKGFVLQELKMNVKDLERKNENVGLLTAELESYENIKKRAEDLKMVRVDNIEYITVIDGAVAKK